ncbi:hypothetical protein [Roseburia faecis]|uniref:hypothetical protein n=1 Tax=Roseburia faecis TaxID=301302 RepID=UPI0032EC2B2E
MKELKEQLNKISQNSSNPHSSVELKKSTVKQKQNLCEFSGKTHNAHEGHDGVCPSVILIQIMPRTICILTISDNLIEQNALVKLV